MSAPRLLDKKTVNAEQADQQRQKISEGIMLAKKVDAVRSTFNEEQQRLEEFRISSTAQVQKEIDAKIQERDSIARENEKLRSERMQIILDANIELETEWRKVKEDKESNGIWQSKLIEQQVNLLARQADAQALSDSLLKRDAELKRKEDLSERTFIGAEEKYDNASKVLEAAEKKSSELFKELKRKENEVLEHESEAYKWDKQLKRLEAQLKDKENELSNREEALRVRYVTFAKAQAYIKSKNK
jgi:hypothetical protein